MKYPKIKVQLSGEDGNAFCIISRVSKALRLGGVSLEEIAPDIESSWYRYDF